MTVLLVILSALAFSFQLQDPDLALAMLAALYALALMMVVVARKSARPVDPNVDRLLAQVRRLNEQRLDNR
jgi:hypothetical protein